MEGSHCDHYFMFNKYKILLFLSSTRYVMIKWNHYLRYEVNFFLCLLAYLNCLKSNQIKISQSMLAYLNCLKRNSIKISQSMEVVINWIWWIYFFPM